MPRVIDNPHYLQPNHKTAMPRHVVYLDTETRPTDAGRGKTEHVFRLGCALYLCRERGDTPETGEWCEFQSIDQFWGWLSGHLIPRRVTYLIGHNIRFDLITLQTFLVLSGFGWRLSFFYDAERTQIFEFRFEHYCIRALSSTNFIPGSLREIAAMMGLTKGSPNFETVDDKELSGYCRNDVLILARAMEQYIGFLENNDLGLFRDTLAAQSFGAFRHRFMSHKVFIHRFVRGIELEESSYHGARCEIFRVGKWGAGPYYKLDVNSMYVSIMARELLPVALSRIEETSTPARLRHALKHQGVIADVTISPTEPIFPVARERANVYPLGTFRTVLTTPELRLALDRGWVVETHGFAAYKMRPLLRQYALWTWEQRKRAKSEGNALYSQLFKDLGNSVFGKFGQRDYWDEIIGECPPDDLSSEHVVNLRTGEQYMLYHICGQVHRIRKAGLGYNALVAVCSHITAHGRLLLWEIIKTAGRAHVLYCDTDSVIVDYAGFERLAGWVDNAELGKLKLEGISPTVEIRARKDYTFGDQPVISGIPADATRTDDDAYQCTIWPALATYLRTPRKDVYTTSTRIQHKTPAVYDGVLTPSGELLPFQLGAE